MRPALLAVLVLAAVPAHAEGLASWQSSLTYSGTASSTFVFTACVAGLSGDVAYRDQRLVLEAFVRERGGELLADVARGDGGALRDLAQAGRVRAEHLGLLAAVLRAHRAEIGDLVDLSRLDTERAVRLFARIGQWIREDARLAEGLGPAASQA